MSHWGPAHDYDAVKDAGIVGVIYKATQGIGFTDHTYVQQQHAAKAAGLKWGAYHFADGSDLDRQVTNFLRFAAPDPDELFCLDWEDNSGDTMSANGVKEWVSKVEAALGRPGECVIYSGNTAKELIDGNDPFFGSRRLWLAQYGTAPTTQESWMDYWLRQFTDGEYGPSASLHRRHRPVRHQLLSGRSAAVDRRMGLGDGRSRAASAAAEACCTPVQRSRSG